jgi:hypothetical protein
MTVLLSDHRCRDWHLTSTLRGLRRLVLACAESERRAGQKPDRATQGHREDFLHRSSFSLIAAANTVAPRECHPLPVPDPSILHPARSCKSAAATRRRSTKRSASQGLNELGFAFATRPGRTYRLSLGLWPRCVVICPAPSSAHRSRSAARRVRALGAALPSARSC